MGLDMLLEILRALKALAAEIALVRLQGNVNTNMRSDVVALHRGGAARVPLACEVEVVGALATNMLLANMFLFFIMLVISSHNKSRRLSTYVEHLGTGETLIALSPSADKALILSSGGSSSSDRG